jgi:hypothetical protein
MARNRTCIIRETLLVTWQERLLKKLGSDFQIQENNASVVVMKRCKVFLWGRTPKTAWVEVAAVAKKDADLHKALNPVLSVHSEQNKERLLAKLDKEPVADQWRLEVYKDNTIPPKDETILTKRL